LTFQKKNCLFSHSFCSRTEQAQIKAIYRQAYKRVLWTSKIKVPKPVL